MDQDNVQKEKSKVIIYREKYTQGKSLHSFIQERIVLWILEVEQEEIQVCLEIRIGESGLG